jgi:homocysteine S-methyltransferase
MSTFLERLNAGPLLCDGAMGTQLFARGIGFDQCFDALNLSRPELVQQIHRGYLDAGAELIETNTFGANAIKLGAHGLADKVRDIAQAGVRLARATVEASGRHAFVLASVGPLGHRLEPLGQVTLEEAQAMFREQIAALVMAAPDALIIETISDVNELRAALLAARELTDLPIIAQMTFAEDGRTILGHSPQAFVKSVKEFGVAVIGANCSVGPGRMFPVIETLLQAARDSKVSAQPNAGWPEQVGDRLIYPSTSEYFAQFARRAVEAGVSIVGGCCGTTPAHIRAMRRALDELSIVRVEREEVEALEELREPLPATEGPTQLAQKLASGKFVVSVEVSPPRGGDAAALLEAARMLKENGVDVLNVADMPMARMRMSPWALCYLVQSQVGMETVLHFPTRGRNLLRVMADLLAAHALGVRNVFIVMGDPSSHGDYPQATDQSDIVPSGLIRLIKQQFNVGLDPAGKAITRATAFHVGAAVHTSAENVDKEIGVLKKKMEAGAEFLLSQPVYEPDQCRRFVERARERLGTLPPILMGLLPLAGARHAEFLHNELPGFSLPEAVRERMRLAGNKGRSEGIKLAQEILLEAREFVQGVYVMPAFERWQTVVEVMGVV